MQYQIDLKIFNSFKKYKRNNKDCLFDPVRQLLIIENPEEIVRQKMLLFLMEKMNIPRDMIDVEVPMCHFVKGAKGRADIVIYGKDLDGILRPVMVVECKGPNIPLTDDVYEQVASYNDILGAYTMMITNGTLMQMWSWENNCQAYVSVAEIPTYKDLIEREKLVFEKEEFKNWQRPEYAIIFSDKVAQEFLDYGWIGEGTPKPLYPFLINLGGFLQNDSNLLQPQVLNGIKILEDGGIRYTSFGNAAGGSWTGDYRYFIIEDDNGNNQIVSISMFGSLKCENHPKFGNRRGHTTLVVAIDDFDKRHNSLQLNIDDYTKSEGNKYTIWHDGKLTIGNCGSCKRDEIINYIKKYAPDLITKEDAVLLGVLDNSREITWDQPETRHFIGRLIRYALVRDQFRKYKNTSNN